MHAEPGPSPGDGGGGRPGFRRGFLVGGATVVAILAIVALVVAVSDSDEPSASQPSTTSTTSLPTTSTTAVPLDLATAVWPFADSPSQYTDPVETARVFAVDFLGFVDPLVGEFRQGDNRSGEVEIRPVADGPATTVFVRLLGTQGWWFVLGAASGAIQIEVPAALAEIGSPVTLRGESTAFEANVQTELRVDGVREPIAEGFVMGGSMGEMGPFEGSLAFPAPSAPSGALVLSTVSMENGNIWEASVVRIHFSTRP